MFFYIQGDYYKTDNIKRILWHDLIARLKPNFVGGWNKTGDEGVCQKNS